jgi:hypothetical protein
VCWKGREKETTTLTTFYHVTISDFPNFHNAAIKLPSLPFNKRLHWGPKKVQLSHFHITIKIMILILSSNHFKELLYIPSNGKKRYLILERGESETQFQ